MWGIIPAAGTGSRIQPLAFSKELLPVGSWRDGATERPRAVCEYLVERMLACGVTRICFVISPGKSDIMEYFGGQIGGADLVYVVQPEPQGLCDALFRPHHLIAPEDEVAIGLPDTIWFPRDGLGALPAGELGFLLFPVERPEFFDAVVTDAAGRVEEIQVKSPTARSHWVWGAFRLPGHVFHALRNRWLAREPRDEFLGTLVNAHLAEGGTAFGVRAGESYVDVGTLNGYREAIRLLSSRDEDVADAAADTAHPLGRLARRGGGAR